MVLLKKVVRREREVDLVHGYATNRNRNGKCLSIFYLTLRYISESRRNDEKLDNPTLVSGRENRDWEIFRRSHIWRYCVRQLSLSHWVLLQKIFGSPDDLRTIKQMPPV